MPPLSSARLAFGFDFGLLSGGDTSVTCPAGDVGVVVEDMGWVYEGSKIRRGGDGLTALSIPLFLFAGCVGVDVDIAAIRPGFFFWSDAVFWF